MATNPEERVAHQQAAFLMAIASFPTLALGIGALIAYSKGFTLVAIVFAVVAVGLYVKVLEFAGSLGEKNAKRVKN